MYLNPITSFNTKSHKSLRQNSCQNKQQAFGKIEPDMLFIKIAGFDKDFNWANTMIKIIDNTAATIKLGKSNLTNLLDGIKNDYRKYFVTNPKKPSDISEESHFGVDRKSDLSTQLIGRYRSYFDKASEMVLKDYSIFDEEQICHNTMADFDKNISLTKTFYNLENFEIYLQHTNAQNIPKVLNHCSKVYDELQSLIAESRNSKGKNNILNEINKKIAQIHWYLANATPYERGSAGITDVLTKSLYESANIQTSPWKTGLAPDMEAFVTSLDEFIEKYPTYFETPPKFIE